MKNILKKILFIFLIAVLFVSLFPILVNAEESEVFNYPNPRPMDYTEVEWNKFIDEVNNPENGINAVTLITGHYKSSTGTYNTDIWKIYGTQTTGITLIIENEFLYADFGAINTRYIYGIETSVSDLVIIPFSRSKIGNVGTGNTLVLETSNIETLWYRTGYAPPPEIEDIGLPERTMPYYIFYSDGTNQEMWYQEFNQIPVFTQVADKYVDNVNSEYEVNWHGTGGANTKRYNETTSQWEEYFSDSNYYISVPYGENYFKFLRSNFLLYLLQN